MPNTSGAVLDWVPQKAAQQTHSATPRRLNANAYASPLGATQRARRSDYGCTSSIHLRNAVKLVRSAQMSAAHAHVRHNDEGGAVRPTRSAEDSSLGCDKLLRWE